MHTVELEEDVYDYLLKNTGRIGEDASSILRRLLRLPSPATSVPTTRSVASPPARDVDPDPLELGGAALLDARNATDKYLAILGAAYAHAPENFDKIMTIAGRKRRYFGRSEAEITTSGQATYPQRIPGSPFWAMTNASTGDKREILRQVLERLGYRPSLVQRACDLIV